MDDHTQARPTPLPTGPSAACCAPAAQQTCCEPAEKAECCDDKRDSASCGCE